MIGNITIKARPLRLAYLIEPNNSTHVQEAIRLSSTLWGGAYFPIIPLYTRMPAIWRDKPLRVPSAQSVIAGYLDAFDPDILVQFSASVPSYIADRGLTIIKPDDVWMRFVAEGDTEAQFGLGIFEILNGMFKEYFRYKSKYPPKLVIPGLPKQRSLFWASIFGELPANIAQSVANHYREPLEIEFTEFDLEHFSELMEAATLFPRRISQWGVQTAFGRRFRNSARVFFLDADKVQDVIDFWNLRAVGGSVLAFPKQFADHPQVRKVISEFVRENRYPLRHNKEIWECATVIRSRNCTMTEMQDCMKALNIKPDPGENNKEPFYSLQHWYPRIWENWGRDRDGANPSDIFSKDEESAELPETVDKAVMVPSVLPKFASEFGYSGHPRCANELSFRLYGTDEHLAEVFPKARGQALDRAISGITSFRGDWRVGRNGLTHLVKRNGDETRYMPAAETVMFAWLKDQGWEPVLSAAGLLAKHMYRQLGGYVGILKDEKLLGLLEHMNGGRVRQDGTPVQPNVIRDDRALPIGEVKKRLEGDDKGNLYDYLISKKIFTLGLKLQCPHCIRRSLYTLDSVHDSFKCPRCSNEFPAIGNVDRGIWCHKTTGPFSVPQYADGAYSVLLTLDLFRDAQMSTMRTTPVVSFSAKSPSKHDLEADFAMFWQESLFGETVDGIMFGECKTYDVFTDKDFKRMDYLRSTFPGAVLVFSTLRRSLTRKEIAGITRIAKAGRKYWKPERPINPVLVLTGTELLGWHAPPYCWEDDIRNRFDRSHGLLGLCDATQQIYLKLESWQKEWHDKWDKRRNRLIAKRDQPAPSTKIAGAEPSTAITTTS